MVWPNLVVATDGMATVGGPCRVGFEAEVLKARADVEIIQCLEFIAWSKRRIKELDSQRAEEVCSALRGRGPVRQIERTDLPPDCGSSSRFRRIGHVTPANGEHVAIRPRFSCATVAPGQANSRLRTLTHLPTSRQSRGK